MAISSRESDEGTLRVIEEALAGRNAEEQAAPVGLTETLLSRPTTAPDIRSALASAPSLNLADILRGSAGAIRPLLEALAPEQPEMDPRHAARLRVSMIFGALAGQRPGETAAAEILREDRARRDQIAQRRSQLAQAFIGSQIQGTIQAAGESAREQARAALQERKEKASLERLKIQEAGRLQRAQVRQGRVNSAEILAGIVGEKERKQFIESNLQMIRARARSENNPLDFTGKERVRAFFDIRISELNKLGTEKIDVQDRLNVIEAAIQSGESTYIDRQTLQQGPAIADRSALTEYLGLIGEREDELREEIEKGPKGAKLTEAQMAIPLLANEAEAFRAFRASLTPERRLQWDRFTDEEKRYVLGRARGAQ